MSDLNTSERILVTSALPYINGVKHMGNLAGSMLPADVYSRAMRLMGHEVLYVCATDEHGTPAELAAAEAGLSVSEYCDKMHGAQAARGDQCDNCGKLLDPVDLINPYSAVSGSHDVEIRDTNHLYLKQSDMSDKLRAWVETHRADWPALTTSIAMKWLDEGLRDRAITRDLEWGVPVVNADGTVREGFDGKVFYVWFDAPIAYIGATQDWAEKTGGDWEKFWRTDKGALGIL